MTNEQESSRPVFAPIKKNDCREAYRELMAAFGQLASIQCEAVVATAYELSATRLAEARLGLP
jgi:hypothetical protein